MRTHADALRHVHVCTKVCPVRFNKDETRIRYELLDQLPADIEPWCTRSGKPGDCLGLAFLRANCGEGGPHSLGRERHIDVPDAEV